MALSMGLLPKSSCTAYQTLTMVQVNSENPSLPQTTLLVVLLKISYPKSTQTLSARIPSRRQLQPKKTQTSSALRLPCEQAVAPRFSNKSRWSAFASKKYRASAFNRKLSNPHESREFQNVPWILPRKNRSTQAVLNPLDKATLSLRILSSLLKPLYRTLNDV